MNYIYGPELGYLTTEHIGKIIDRVRNGEDNPDCVGHLRSVCESGRQAYRDGLPESACPEQDTELRNMWLEGWHEEHFKAI